MKLQPLPHSIDTCLLVTKVDAEAVLGEAVEDPLCDVYAGEVGQPLITTCTYVTLSESPIKGISILVSQSTTVAEAVRLFQQAKGQAEPHVQLMPGIGDDAFWSGRSSQFYARKGNVWFVISADSAGGFNSAESARTLALTAVDRLH